MFYLVIGAEEYHATWCASVNDCAICASSTGRQLNFVVGEQPDICEGTFRALDAQEENVTIAEMVCDRHFILPIVAHFTVVGLKQRS